MDKVLIFDDFLTTNEISMCMTTLTKPHWGFGHFSSTIIDSVNNIPFWTMDLNHCPIFEVYIKKKIEAAMNKELSGGELATINSILATKNIAFTF